MPRHRPCAGLFALVRDLGARMANGPVQSYAKGFHHGQYFGVDKPVIELARLALDSRRSVGRGFKAKHI
jgi:hypothetical protein